MSAFEYVCWARCDEAEIANRRCAADAGRWRSFPHWLTTFRTPPGDACGRLLNVKNRARGSIETFMYRFVYHCWNVG